MAVQMPLSGLRFMHRIVRISTSSQRHFSRDILHECRTVTRAFSTASVKRNEDEGVSSDSLAPTTKLTPRQELLSRRRRPLSPLERISSLLPQDTLSPEVMLLREQDQQEDTNTQVESGTQEEDRHAEVQKEEDSETQHASHAATETKTQLNSAFHVEKGLFPSLPGESLLSFGELLVAEFRKKGQVEFKKMFELQAGERLSSMWGIVMHGDIAGQPAGCFLKTSKGFSLLIRRPSLEDYVVLMRRVPAIAYPKDSAMMLMMMDVTEGDCVLESGSGSGAMSLFLSRAVGSKGSVLSVEVKKDHHRRAVKNYQSWRKSWSLRRGEEWPDNVHFHHTDLCTASSLLAGQGFNAVALDMSNPQLVLPTVFPHLHHGAVCAVYVISITQIIDLLEGIRCLALPLLCERIIEVPIRDWLVAPARQKDGSHCVKKAPVLNRDQSVEEEEEEEDKEEMTKERPGFWGIPYLSRPHSVQLSHTAFLVKLRKCVR